jgi:uncharacterized protein YacL
VSINAAIRLAGFFVGLLLAYEFIAFEQAHGNPAPLLQILAPLGGAILGGLGAPYVTILPYASISRRLASTPMRDLAAGVVGLAVALAIAAIAAVPVLALSWTPGRIAILPITVVLAYMGWNTGLSKRHELAALVWGVVHPGSSHVEPRADHPLLLDTSVIIDGRILEVVHSGFIDTPLLVPRFVLLELQAIADSSDPVRRARGRRGLDVLDSLQREGVVKVDVLKADFPEIAEVDTKLMRLAHQADARILTNDYNLMKVAALEGLRVLNLNDLARALKPSVMPGEELEVLVLKEGREAGQGVGYLEDGTMVVVEGGRRLIGQTVRTNVATVLQTAAGRLIFTQPQLESPSPAAGAVPAPGARGRRPAEGEKPDSPPQRVARA